jgi:hypothetical protein
MPVLTNYWPGFWVDLRTAIRTQWPEVATNLRTLQAQKINWVNLVEGGQMAFPYIVIHVEPARDMPEWGIQNEVYGVDVTFYYLAADAQGIAPTLEAKMKLMQDYLLSTPSAWTTLQVLEMRAVDVTEVNAVNASMLEQHTPFTAGAVSFTCLVGETLV